MPEKFQLSYADYGVVSFLLVTSAAIGLYFSRFGGKQKTNNDYLFAGKDMSIFPISLSLMASFISASALIGLPAEMYLFGTNMAFMNLGFVLGPIIASSFFLPKYFKMGVATPYEYLEKRFGQTTRRILSVIFLLQNVLFSSVSLYAPALSLSAVTNLSLWISVISIATVCIFYSTFGGMKAVVWTDVFQAILMYTCLTSVIVKGCLDLGGIQAIFKTAYDGQRIVIPTYQVDFSIRYTIWSIFLQGFVLSTYCFVAHQSEVQRLLTLKNVQRSTISSLLSIPMIVTFQLLCCLCGIIIYAYFQSCDPVTSPNHTLYSYDQLLPYYIVSAMNEYSGLPGLCITGIFSVSLSTVSSSINAMAGVTYHDIIRPVWTDIKKEVLITKSLNIFYGVLSIFVTLVVASMGNLVKASILVVGMVGGIALAVFFLASFTTTANEMGVNVGVLTGFLLTSILTFILNGRCYPKLPVQMNCSEDITKIEPISVAKSNISWHGNVSCNIESSGVRESSISDNFPVSFMWIAPLSLVVCFVVGYISSWIILKTRGTSVKLSFVNPFRKPFSGKSQHSKQCQKIDIPVYTTYSVRKEIYKEKGFNE